MIPLVPTTEDLGQSDKPTVLVAEDDLITRRLLIRFLEKYGYTVLSAENGEQAWELYRQEQPRLVLTDWQMPKVNGLELCQRIRRTESTEYTFIIILTSDTDHDAMIQGFQAGADDFVTKPFDQAELNWRLNSGVRVLQLHSCLENRIRELDEARAELEQANVTMREGLAAAAKSQQALLPTAPPDVQGVHCSWIYEPCDDLGGDSLNIFELDDSTIGFFLADVCGHGITSALLAVTINRVMTPAAAGTAGLLRADDGNADLFRDPGRVLTEVNQRLPISIENSEYFTAVYGTICTKTGELKFAGAGHPSPVVLSTDGTAKQLACDGFPIGFDNSNEYETQSLQLRAGDCLCIYSDGIVEATAPSGEMYGLERLVERMRAHGKSPEQKSLVNEVVSEVSDWSDTVGQQDDVSLLLVEFLGRVDAAAACEVASANTAS